MTTTTDPPIAASPPALEAPKGPIVNCKGCGTHFYQSSATVVHCPRCLKWIESCRWLNGAASVKQKGWR